MKYNTEFTYMRRKTFNDLLKEANEKSVIVIGSPNVASVFIKKHKKVFNFDCFCNLNPNEKCTSIEQIKIKNKEDINFKNKITVIAAAYEDVYKIWLALFEMKVQKIFSLPSMELLEHGILPNKFQEVELENVKNGHQMRCFMVKDLHGDGIEVAAKCNPMPYPKGCNIRYIDVIDDGVCPVHYPMPYCVNVDIQTDFQDMNGIENESLDFILSSHVIEHVRNPMKPLEMGWKKLKKGGKMIFCVPDKEKTYDVDRDVTLLSHFIDDYLNYVKERDILHYVDFLSKAKDKLQRCPTSIQEIYKRVLEFYNKDFVNIHYHVWTYNSFYNMVS